MADYMFSVISIFGCIKKVTGFTSMGFLLE